MCSVSRITTFVVMLICTILPDPCQASNIVRIGAIFTEPQRSSALEIAFKYAVYRINMDPTVLPNTTLVHLIKYTPENNSYIATKLACELIESDVMAIFGPMNSYLAPHVHSICDTLDIPHLECHLSVDNYAKAFSVNVYPHQTVMNQAYTDIMIFLNWTKVLIIFEEEAGLIKLQDLIRSPTNADIEVIVRQGTPNNFRDILKEVKSREVFNLIVDTKPESMETFLRAILQMQMNDYKYHYLFATYDIETFNLEDFKYNFVNITAFRLVDSQNFYVRKILQDMEEFQPINDNILHQSDIIQASPALIYDSVLVFARALSAFRDSVRFRAGTGTSCEKEVPWPDGSSFYNYMNTVKEIGGLTGPIEFTEGKRTTFKLDLLKLKQQDLVKVGEWTPTKRVNITDHKAFYDPGTLNVTLIITTNLDKPYVMLREDPTLSGNERFEGFCIDLLRSIANFVGFNYTIVLNPDGKYGAQDQKTGEWNGLVRQLVDKKADLAVGSMSISYARESVIDFTKPFMNLGISILFKVPTRQETRLFSFMNPLAVNIWLYMIVAYALVSLTMFIVARFSPYEWRSPHPCLTETGIVENQFSMGNSFWFTIGTLMQQGSDLNPKAISTRIVGGIWWFFTLIIISSYTANLAAFLTVERMITPIESAEDLAEQSDINYGTLEGGSTMTFFRDSKIDTYKRMWRFMESKKPTVFTKSYDEGIARVLDGNYAFLAESTTIDYIVNRNCNLTQIGGLLDSKGFGIGTTIGSPWRDPISLAILELQEKAVIHTLYNKWWKDTSGACSRTDKNNESKASELGVANIGGVFVVLLCGLAFAVCVAFVEFCWNAKRNAQLDKQSLCSEMVEELRFAVRCHASHQRPALTRQCDRCMPAATANATTVPAAAAATSNSKGRGGSSSSCSGGGGSGGEGYCSRGEPSHIGLAGCDRVPSTTSHHYAALVQSNGECAVPDRSCFLQSDQANYIRDVASCQPMSRRRR